jgi:hypothetical protein
MEDAGAQDEHSAVVDVLRITTAPADVAPDRDPPVALLEGLTQVFLAGVQWACHAAPGVISITLPRLVRTGPVRRLR